MPRAARCASVTSRKISTTPMMFPWSSLIGAALSSIDTLGAIPGDEDRVVRQPHDPTFPQRTGCGVLGWLPALLIDDVENAVERPVPGLPVQSSRSGTQPRGSRRLHALRCRCVITASPMLESVTRSHSDCFCSACSARLRSVMSRKLQTRPTFRSSTNWILENRSITLPSANSSRS